jgi:3-phosphoshikimate 1-carboxyvinyltransferase
LPPSKSYLHRSLFVASLCKSKSRIENSGGGILSDDVSATVRALRALGQDIEIVEGDMRSCIAIHPSKISSGNIFAGGSGTTARFAIAFAAISTDGKRSTITGDDSLLKRPIRPLLEALSQIGVRCYSGNSDGRLPAVVESNGIEGGDCLVDGSISSQFISALLIAGTQARKDTMLKITDVRKAVSLPYIDATISVLNYFRFKIQVKKSENSCSFLIKANQTRTSGRTFRVPGDMSSAAALIGATLSARGTIRMHGIDAKMPQADSAFLEIAKKLGARITNKGRDGTIEVDAKYSGEIKDHRLLSFDLKDSPDLVPIVIAAAAALGNKVKAANVGHLRFKESDRLGTLAQEYKKLGLVLSEGKDSLAISSSMFHSRQSIASPLILSSENDHRILMSLVIAGISGKFGEFWITNPSCVKKSYPAFISDLKSLMKNERVISLVKRKDD